MRYIAYGSNMVREQMDYRCPDAKLIGTGYIAGARNDYRDGETETVAKSIDTLEVGDRIDFLCDYYAYDGSYMDSYYLGEQMTVGDSIVISNTDIGKNKALITYRFTDIYNQAYWSPAIER